MEIWNKFNFSAGFLATMACALGIQASAEEKTAETELIIEAKEVKIGGILSLPSELKSDALVIMSSGSGPQDQQGTLEGFEVFREIAEHLTAEGIASYRFADRGVWKSTGSFMNSELDDLTRDIHSIMDYFQASDEHQFEKFILLGHSMGGIVVGNAGVGKDEVTGVILMASPAAMLSELILYQVRQEYIFTDVEKALIEEEVSAHNRMMWAIRGGQDTTEIVNEMIASVEAILEQHPDYEGADETKIKKAAEKKATQIDRIYKFPNIDSFTYHEPAKDFAQLKVPVLSLFGGKDIQVTIDQNKDRMENALILAGVPYHFVTLQDANHFFQKAVTGQRDEYRKLDRAFVDGLLPEISNWILDLE